MHELSEGHALTKAEAERYSRQLVLPEVGPAGQRRLKASSALVIGAGGLGIPASVYLAAAGVGRVGIVDHDLIERSNLHRQTLFAEPDVGKAKAKVAKEKLEGVNPHVTIDAHSVKLDSSNAMDLLKAYDVVVDCTDNFPARYLINDACVLLGKPDVYASVFRFDGQASVFDSRVGPCYRCLFPAPPPPDSVQDCAVAGVLGVLPGIMGSIQAVQTVNLILDRGHSLVGRLLLFNATDMEFTELRVRRDKDCPVCGATPTIRKLIDYEAFCGLSSSPSPVEEITPMELKGLIDQGAGVLLLDVRERYEHEFSRLAGSTLIPLGELESRMGELSRDNPIVVYCHVGARSARAAKLLSSRGFRVKNLRGGITAWAQQVDPSLPVY